MKWTEKGDYDLISSPNYFDGERVIRRRVNILSISEDGNERIIRKFLFKPLCIGKEKKWLEFVKIKQKKIYVDMDIPYWENIEWIDDYTVSMQYGNKSCGICNETRN